MALPDELTALGLSGWTERFGAEDVMLLASIFPSRGAEHPGNATAWDRIDMGREAAGFQAYNQPGDQIALTGRTRISAIAPTIREAKRIPGEYIQWLLSPGSTTQAQGRLAVDRELRDLRGRIARRQEIMRSQIMCGGNITGGIGADTTAIDIDFGMLATHIDWGAANWDTTTTDVIEDLEDGIALVEQDGGVSPDTLLCGRNIPRYLALNDDIQALMSERQKEELSRGMVTRIPGVELDIVPYRKGYIDVDGDWTYFIGADACVLYSSDMGGSSAHTIECSSPDALAGTAQRGVFVHAWDEVQPPRGVWVSMELTALPVLANPEAICYDSDVTA